MYLLDTMVLSELRKKKCDSGVIEWLSDKADQELFISVVSVGEITKGIAQQDKRDQAFAKKLRQWLDKLLLVYSERILPVDISIARRWGELSVLAQNSGVDILLAATALEHNLTVVTRNEKHFVTLGVKIINPWRELP
jgi:predicted nucleic acid-binding protein